MVKKYNDFIKSKMNEKFVMAPGKPETVDPEIEINPGTREPIIEPAPPSLIPDETEQDSPAKAIYGEEEEEGEDLYAKSLQRLADMLGVEVENGSVNYEGKKIIFPAETEMYHVDKKKFRTAEEVVNYLESSVEKPEMSRQDKEVVDNQAIEDLEMEFKESKSYKTTRSFRKFR